ncbi:MAG: arginine--tRNA ligase [Proteobacteria bacterium]|nr:arginine--tRNA ligase [Pseudomonadota bacterium]
MQNIFAIVRDDIRNIITDENIYSHLFEDINFVVEIPNNKAHGDIAVNIAMVLAKLLKKNPRDLAAQLCLEISKNLSYVESADVAGPGFINLKIKNLFWQDLLKKTLTNYRNHLKLYDAPKDRSTKCIHIEFLSANPTGPMHIGHIRCAIVGDVVAKILKYTGYKVFCEYYVNDAGKQIDALTNSLFSRYCNLLGKDVVFPEDGYPGNYLIDIAKRLYDEKKDTMLSAKNEDFKEFAINSVMELIKSDLDKLKVKFDSFISEKEDVYPKLQDALDLLESKNLLYRGLLDNPKGKVINSKDKQDDTEQLIFKSKKFGDDVDRVIKKQNKELTYFAGDIAYHYHKIKRGFNNLILFLGADHIGYNNRIKAATSALSDNLASIRVENVQLVKLLKNGSSYKMSKRAGNFINVDDILSEMSVDELRISMLLKNHDTNLEIDVENIKNQSKENPIFYIQYSHARACSVLRFAKEKFNMEFELMEKTKYESVDFSLLKEDFEIDVIKTIALFPKIIDHAAENLSPHKIVYYIISLANSFHRLWNAGSENKNMHFIIPDNAPITIARIALVQCFSIIISESLNIIGVKPLEQM